MANTRNVLALLENYRGQITETQANRLACTGITYSRENNQNIRS